MIKAVEIKNLTKKFKNRTAVDNLSFDVEKGEILALLGQNGAGKTTTVRMLSCLTAPTSGDAYIGGHSIVTDSSNVKKIINVAPQETAVAGKLTVRENLQLIAEIYGSDKKTAKEKTDKILSEFNLSEREKDKSKKLSGGMQRKLSIAMALITNPEILFLDEPTVGLDVRARRELWKHIEALKGKVTVILTTHYLEEAEALADRVVIMNEGKLSAYGTVEEIKEKAETDSFEDAFLKFTDDGECDI